MGTRRRFLSTRCDSRMHETILKRTVSLRSPVIGHLWNHWVGEREMRPSIFWHIFETYSLCFSLGCVSLLFMQIISSREIDDEALPVTADLNLLYEYKRQHPQYAGET